MSVDKNRSPELLSNPQERISQLHKCFLQFSSDSLHNIKIITETIGRLLNATSAFYNRLDGNLLCSWGVWKAPGDLKHCDNPEGHICYQVISNSSSDVLHIRDLQNSRFAKTDPTVIPYKLETYIGKAVSLDGQHIGSLCAVFQCDVVPDEEELKIFDILSSAVAIEEKRLQNSKELKKSAEQYRDLYQNSTIGIYRSTPEGKIIFANPTFIMLLGYNSLEELKEITIQESIHLNKDDRNKFVEILEREEVIHGYIVKLRKKNGVPLIVRESASVIKNDSGEIVFYEGTVEDITEQSQTAMALIESEGKFRSIFESGGSGIIITDCNGKITDINPKFCEIFGYTKQELLGFSFFDLTHPDDIENSRKMINGLYKGEYDHFQMERKYIRKDGTTMWGSIAVGLFKDKITNEDNNVGIFEDITERVNLINELKKRDQVLSALTFSTETFLKTLDWRVNIQEVLKRLGESLNIGVVYVYQNEIEDGDIVATEKFYWASEKLTEIKNKSVLQKFSYKINGFESLLNSLQKKEVFSSSISNYSKAAKKWLSLKSIKSILIVPIFEISELWGFLGFNDYESEREWTEQEKELLKTAGNVLGVAIKRKRFEEELLIAKLKAEESDKLKSQFLAQISHEIRSPINTILSFSGLLQDSLVEDVSEELSSSFDIIASAGKRITRTIDLILNMSEIQTGTYKCIPRNIDIYHDILENLITEFKGLAVKLGLEFKINVNTNDTIRVIDHYTITQVFVNLLDNAFKYTKKGSVELSLFKENDKLCVSIKDTGIGISKEYLPRLFAPFSQEDQGYTREFEGNGLGLALVKNYCDLNNASITVESEKNKGTIFKVIFDS